MPESNEDVSPLKSALSAEQEAFDYYDPQPKEHCAGNEFDLRMRVLEAGEEPPLVIAPGVGGLIPDGGPVTNCTLKCGFVKSILKLL